MDKGLFFIFNDKLLNKNAKCGQGESGGNAF